MTTTTTAPLPTRRAALRLFGAAPMLPLGAVSFLSGCGGGNDPIVTGTTPTTPPTTTVPPVTTPVVAANFRSAEFVSMAAPNLSNPAAMATTTVGSTMRIAYDDGSAVDYQLAYQPFFMTGDMVPNGSGGTILAGGYVDAAQRPIVAAALSTTHSPISTMKPLSSAAGTNSPGSRNPRVGWRHRSRASTPTVCKPCACASG